MKILGVSSSIRKRFLAMIAFAMSGNAGSIFNIVVHNSGGRIGAFAPL